MLQSDLLGTEETLLLQTLMHVTMLLNSLQLTIAKDLTMFGPELRPNDLVTL